MAHRHKKAGGGGVKPKRDGDKEEYNAQGSHVMKEEHERKDGGRVKRKDGGKVPGRATGGRLNKFARGGHVHASGKDMTSSPFSAAHVKSGDGPGSNPSPHVGGK